jgi:hypothetical protein
MANAIGSVKVGRPAESPVVGDRLGKFDFVAFAETLSALEGYVDSVIEYGTADGADAWIEDEVTDARLASR